MYKKAKKISEPVQSFILAGLLWIVLLAVLFGAFPQIGRSETVSYESRTQQAMAQNLAEINRRQALKMQEIKERVLIAEKELEQSNVVVTTVTNAGAFAEARNKSTQE